MPLPDYDRSIVNLMASIGRGLGAGDEGYAPLPELPPRLMQHRPVVLLVIDGLGAELLARYPETHLHRRLRRSITSVFPSTTAAAMTTFATGAAPQQHAVTGWFTWMKELGCVAMPLPFRPRCGCNAFSNAGVTPRQLIGRGPLSERLRVESVCVNPEPIADSDYSRFAAGSSIRYGHRGLENLFQRLRTRVAEGEPGYLFGYWSELDTLSHQFGAGSGEVRDHLMQVDNAFGRFLDSIEGSGALVILTADHGLIDTRPDRIVALESHAELAGCLALPLCGEPRAAFCYVRPRKVAEFEARVRDELGHCCELIESERLLAEGWFGRGRPDARLLDRIGDYLLLMREEWVIHDRLPHEGGFHQVGVHGGISGAEMEVPLIVAEC